jgi:hypothetical protein
MNWTRLYTLPTESFLSKKLLKEATDLNKRVERQLAERDQWDRGRKTRLSRQIEEMTAEQIAGEPLLAQGENAELLRLLAVELTLRREISAFDERHHEEQLAAASAALQRIQAAEEDTRQKLLALGYVPANPHEPTPGAITPDMIARHPAVRTARMEYEHLQTQANARDFLRDNEAARKSVTQEIERRRAAAA